MYDYDAALGLTRASNRSSPIAKPALYCRAGHVRLSCVRRMDWSEWSTLPRKFLTSWVDAPRCEGRAHSVGHDLTRELQLIGFNLDRAAV
jgi:hypothetical protein